MNGGKRHDRRQVLKIFTIGGVATALVMPTSWTRPFVKSVVVPAHAQASPRRDGRPTTTPVPTTTGSGTSTTTPEPSITTTTTTPEPSITTTTTTPEPSITTTTTTPEPSITTTTTTPPSITTTTTTANPCPPVPNATVGQGPQGNCVIQQCEFGLCGL